MNTVLTIFKKELVDILRDRRTLLMMVVIPMLLFPVLITIVAVVQISVMRKAEKKVLKAGLLTHGNAAAFRDTLLARKDLEVIETVEADSIPSLIQNGRLDAVVVVDPDFDQVVGDLKVGRIRFYHKSSDDIGRNLRRRVLDVVQAYEKTLIAERFRRLGLDEEMVRAVRFKVEDVASSKEKIGKLLGGFLPYLFVIFCFVGSTYPAIDLGAGEKERGTLETLLATPASRLQILIGKFGVVALAGIGSAAIAMLGLVVVVRTAAALPSRATDSLLGLIEPATILTLLSLLVPLAAFFAAGLLSISIFARSFKEAQSLMTPLSIVVILPVLIGLMPGVELDATTALIPVLNVSLASKEIIAGTISYGLLAEVYGSLVVLAGLSLYGCARWFGRESTIFRSS